MHPHHTIDPVILSARYYRNGRDAALRTPTATEAQLVAPLAVLTGPHADAARTSFLDGVRSVRRSVEVAS